MPRWLYHNKMVSLSPKELEGKKIVRARLEKISKDYDDKPYLILEMDNGEVFKIVSFYEKYTGKSHDEYPRKIKIIKEKDIQKAVELEEADVKAIRLNHNCKICKKPIYIGDGTIINGVPMHFECFAFQSRSMKGDARGFDASHH